MQFDVFSALVKETVAFASIQQGGDHNPDKTPNHVQCAEFYPGKNPIFSLGWRPSRCENCVLPIKIQRTKWISNSVTDRIGVMTFIAYTFPTTFDALRFLLKVCVMSHSFLCDTNSPKAKISASLCCVTSVNQVAGHFTRIKETMAWCKITNHHWLKITNTGWIIRWFDADAIPCLWENAAVVWHPTTSWIKIVANAFAIPSMRSGRSTSSAAKMKARLAPSNILKMNLRKNQTFKNKAQGKYA